MAKEADSNPETDTAGEPNPADSNPSEDTAGEPEALEDIIDAVTQEISEVAAEEDQGKAKPDAKPEQDEVEVTGDEPSGETADAEQTVETKQEDVDTSLQAPEQWDAERKAAFEALPTPESKKVLLDTFKGMEAAHTRKSQELSEQAKFAETIKGEFTDQDRQYMARQGLDEVSSIRQLVALQRFATSDPENYIKSVSQTLGVDLNKLVGNSSTEPGDSQDEWEDPSIADLRQQVSGIGDLVKQTVQQTLQGSETERLQTELTSFQTATDDEGQLKRPHFNDVSGLFVHFANQPSNVPEVQAVQALPNGQEKYQQLYDLAVRAHPTLGPKAIEAEALAKAAKDAEASKKQKAVNKAKRASTPGLDVDTSSAGAVKELESLDDIINDAMSQA